MKKIKFIDCKNFTFILFISLIVVLVSGMPKESFVGSVFMFILLMFVLLIAYAVWNVLYKLGVFIYETRLKEFVIEYKKAKEEIQK